MAFRGYLSSFVEEVNKANRKKLGVQLAKRCIANDIPVIDIADYFGVTRMTIYSWFRGKTNVPERKREKVQSLLDKLR